MAADTGPFLSWRWVGASLAIFLLVEIALGIGVGELVAGRYLSLGTAFWVRGSIQLAAFFIGGVVVGVVSPSVRVLEPALGGAAAVGLTALTAIFTPYGHIRMGSSRLMLAGGIAFGLALAGAWVGERLTGKLRT